MPSSLVNKTSGVPKGGFWGSGPHTHFSKSWSSRFAQNCNTVGGGGVGQICQEVVCENLEKQARNGFARVGSKVLVSKKYFNTAGRGILSQSRMHIFENFPGVLPADQLISIFLVISA